MGPTASGINLLVLPIARTHSFANVSPTCTDVRAMRSEQFSNLAKLPILNNAGYSLEMRSSGHPANGGIIAKAAASPLYFAIQQATVGGAIRCAAAWRSHSPINFRIDFPPRASEPIVKRLIPSVLNNGRVANESVLARRTLKSGRVVWFPLRKSFLPSPVIFPAFHLAVFPGNHQAPGRRSG